MKIKIKFLLLLTTFALATGCAGLVHHSDPLLGWRSSSLNSLHSNKAIMNDYQDYIQNLPPKVKQYVGPVDFFEDANGQHAVEIEIALNGRWWFHILIYDKDDRRVKVIKYSPGKYRS